MNKEWSDLQSSIVSTCRTREASGWHSIMCPMCDGGKDKRVTGGFLFTDDTIVYKCFRGKCGADTGMELGQYVPKKFSELLDKIGISIPMKIRTAKRRARELSEEVLDSTLYQKHSYETVMVPDYWIPIKDSGKMNLAFHLEDRCCRLDDVHYIDDGKYEGLLGLVHKWYGRPVGLTVLGKSPFKIEGSNSMMYSLGGNISNDMVVLVEGEIDAMSFPNAVSVGGHKVSPQQAYLLRGKNVVCVPELGNHFIDQYEQYGWRMCVPMWDAGDLNEAVVKYGVLVVARMIRESIVDNPLRAKLEYNNWISKQNRGGR